MHAGNRKHVQMGMARFLVYAALVFAEEDSWNYDNSNRRAAQEEVVSIVDNGTIPALPVPKPISLEERLSMFYSRHAPSQASNEKINELLDYYKDDIDTLNSMLKESYGEDLHSVDEGEITKLKLGESMKLDKLGPLVVNVDGTTMRITYWQKMTLREQKVALRRISKRNKKRLAALKAKQQAEREL